MYIDNRVTGKTKLIGLLGNPVEHSISPQLHNTISSSLGVDFIYVPFKVEKGGLENAIKGLKALNVVGFNVTTPYKKDVMKYIDDNTKEALLMGAVNAVKNIEGRLYGYNTDAEGFYRSFKETVGTGFKGKRVVILGAGGASRAIALRIAIDGAEKITIINRTLSKASDIAEIISNNYGSLSKALEYEDSHAVKAFTEGDIIINTTSLGMVTNIENNPISKGMEFSSGQTVYDIIYNPIKTKFLAAAEEKGCKTINGLGMLFYQGINAYEIWTGVKLSEDMIKETYQSFINILNK